MDGTDIQRLFKKISICSEKIDRLLNAAEKLKRGLMMVRNVHNNLQNRILNLEKQQSKSEQYNRRKFRMKLQSYR